MRCDSIANFEDKNRKCCEEKISMQAISPASGQRDALLEIGSALESRLDDWLGFCSSSVSNTSSSLEASDSSLDSPGFTTIDSDIVLDELVAANIPAHRSIPLPPNIADNSPSLHTILLLDITLSTPATLVIRLPHTQAIQSPVCLHYSTLLDGGLESIVIIEVWARDLGMNMGSLIIKAKSLSDLLKYQRIS